MGYTTHSIILDLEDRIRKNDQHNIPPSDELVCTVTYREQCRREKEHQTADVKTHSVQYP